MTPISNLSARTMLKTCSLIAFALTLVLRPLATFSGAVGHVPGIASGSDPHSLYSDLNAYPRHLADTARFGRR